MNIIIAAADNGVIGKNNDLPWHIPDDLKYFKETTMGFPMIMGRKTFESLGRPLPGRRHLIITRNKSYSPEEAINSIRKSKDLKPLPSEKFQECHTFQSLEESKEFLKEDFNSAFLIGGAQLFEVGLPLCKKLYLTKVHKDFDGDVFLPEVNYSDFKLIKEDRKQEPFAHTYCLYERT